jgi:hypothetical protein
MQKKQSPNYISILLIAGLMLAACQPLPAASTTAEAYPPPDSAATEAAKPATEIPPYPGPIEITATPTPPAPLPQCNYQASSETLAYLDAIPVGDFRFSEPQVVYTSQSPTDVAQWVIPSEQLLIQTYDPEQLSVGILDIRKDTVTPLLKMSYETYAPGKLARWMSSVNEALLITQSKDYQFFDFNLIANPDSNNALLQNVPYKSIYMLNPETEELLVFPRSEALEFSDAFAVSPVDKSVSGFELSASAEHALTLYSGTPPVWQPKGNLVAFYSWEGVWLIDTETGVLCDTGVSRYEIFKYQPWFGSIAWSDDGRFLVTSDLTVLDVWTGQANQLSLIDGLQGGDVNISWYPNSYNLMVSLQGVRGYGEFYIIDVINDKSLAVLTDHQNLFINSNLRIKARPWSPDGQQLALYCPILDERNYAMAEQTCTITVGVEK